jgi:hypothetical protein
MEGPSSRAIISFLDPSMLDPEGYKPYLYRADKENIFNPAMTISSITEV